MKLLLIIFILLITLDALADNDMVQVSMFYTHIAIEGKHYKNNLWQSLNDHFDKEIPPLVITGDLSCDELSSILIEAEKRDIQIGLLTKPEKSE